jgi:hypothetical protein
MGQLAAKMTMAATKMPAVTEEQIKTLAVIGVGYVKTEIQRMHAVDTGTMLNSTTATRISKSVWHIGPTVFYAPYVALGTSRMAARPFHIVAARRMQGAINQGNLLGDLGL